MTRTHTAINPGALHDPTPFGYSHTALLEPGARLVLVSGQYGSGPDGAVVATDFDAQLTKAFDNLEVALAAHDLALRNVVQLRTYVVGLDFARLGLIATQVRRCGDTPPAQTVLGVASLAAPDILFEVEALAASK